MRLQSTLFLALTGTALSQGGVTDPTPVSSATQGAPFVLPADVVLHDAPEPGVLVAAGATWKATFSAQGATYVPFLGSDAPRNYPVTFEVTEVSVGGRSVVLDGNATVRREGDRILIDRGSVIEVYDCSPDAVEQSFLFPVRARAGEVEVTLDVRTDLEGVDEGAELSFLGARGGVRYGEAFAFDGAGRRASVRRRFDGRSIALTVPADFPVEEGNVLTLDPLISTHAISPNTHSGRAADVAFEKDMYSDGAYRVVYERFFSQGDTDAYVVAFNPANNFVSSAIVLDVSSDSWSDVRVATNDGNDQALIVATVLPSGGGNRRVCGRQINGALDVGPVFTVNENAGARDAFSPDVGGERVPFTGSGYLVAWEETGQFNRGNVVGRVVNANGTFLGPQFDISSNWAWNEGAPRVSATTGEYLAGPSLFNVTWELRASAGQRRVRAAQIRFDGVITQAPFHVTDLDCHSPSVSSTQATPLADLGTRPFLIAYTRETASGGDVMLAICDENGVVNHHNLSEKEGVAWNDDQRDPVIAQTGDSYLVAYSEYDTLSLSQFETYMMTLDLTETGGAPEVALAERHVHLSNHVQNASRFPAIASEYEMGGTSDDALVVWQDWVENAPIFSGIRSAHVDAYSSTGAIGIQYCKPESNSTARSGWLAAFGSQAPTGLKVLLGSDLPANSIAFFLAATAPADVLQPGGSLGRLCIGGSIGRYSSFAAPTTPTGTTFMLLNPTQIAQPGGPVTATSGQRWYFQLWHRDSVQGQARSNFTNAIAIDFR